MREIAAMVSMGGFCEPEQYLLMLISEIPIIFANSFCLSPEERIEALNL